VKCEEEHLRTFSTMAPNLVHQLGNYLELEPGSVLEVIYDFFVGIVVGSSHSLYFAIRFGYNLGIAPALLYTGLLHKLEEPQTNFDGLKVIGVGYGRTGTVSFF
jgi:branched-subunit amino acid ABC-type transport system permease component